jgi:prepilin signal peptidase PulO-like enzyme (type II secretory pathway)
MEAIFGAVFFGLASYVGILLAGTVGASPFEDGPASVEPPVPWIVAGAAVIGGLLVTRTAGPQNIVIEAIVICALSAVWCTDSRYGIVPDAFTLVPLAIVLGIAFYEKQGWPIISSAIAFVPFACLAVISKGRGMGWGDVKLAALGGAVLGGETALAAFAAGSVIAVLHAYVRGRQSSVIAFAPYLAGAIAFALPLAAP